MTPDHHPQRLRRLSPCVLPLTLRLSYIVALSMQNRLDKLRGSIANRTPLLSGRFSESRIDQDVGGLAASSSRPLPGKTADGRTVVWGAMCRGGSWTADGFNDVLFKGKTTSTT